jgi:hypothetical protein
MHILSQPRVQIHTSSAPLAPTREGLGGTNSIGVSGREKYCHQILRFSIADCYE